MPSGYKCLERTICSTTLNAPIANSCIGNVADGKWHHSVLTLSPGTICPQGSYTCQPGSFSQTATLYVDGKSLATTTTPVQATASATGYTADIGNGPNGDFTGSIADVSFYTTQLSSTDVAAHYQAPRSQSIPTGVTPPATPPVNIQTVTVTVTDPASKTASYVYATGALVRAVSVLGGVTSYGYDAALRASAITDPDGDTTYVTYDAHNNVSSTITCAAINNCQTAYSSYYENLSNPLDPRNDKPTDSRDARSSSPYDPAYDTVTTYTSSAQIATRTTPPTAACPSGCKTSYAYTTGSEAAVGGGTEPAGLLASITAPGGGVTGYAYDSAGDVMQNTSSYTYDAFGNRISQTNPAGVTTAYTYDDAGNLLTTTLQGYTGNPSNPSPPANLVQESRAYDPAGRLASVTNVKGTQTNYTYYADNRLASSYVVCPSCGNGMESVNTYGYDAAGNRITESTRAAWSSTPITTPPTRSPPRRWTRQGSIARSPPPTTPTGMSSPRH